MVSFTNAFSALTLVSSLAFTDADMKFTDFGSKSWNRTQDLIIAPENGRAGTRKSSIAHDRFNELRSNGILQPHDGNRLLVVDQPSTRRLRSAAGGGAKTPTSFMNDSDTLRRLARAGKSVTQRRHTSQHQRHMEEITEDFFACAQSSLGDVPRPDFELDCIESTTSSGLPGLVCSHVFDSSEVEGHQASCEDAEGIAHVTIDEVEIECGLEVNGSPALITYRYGNDVFCVVDTPACSMSADTFCTAWDDLAALILTISLEENEKFTNVACFPETEPGDVDSGCQVQAFGGGPSETSPIGTDSPTDPITSGPVAGDSTDPPTAESSPSTDAIGFDAQCALWEDAYEPNSPFECDCDGELSVLNCAVPLEEVEAGGPNSFFVVIMDEETGEEEFGLQCLRNGPSVQEGDACMGIVWPTAENNDTPSCSLQFVDELGELSGGCVQGCVPCTDGTFWGVNIDACIQEPAGCITTDMLFVDPATL